MKVWAIRYIPKATLDGLASGDEDEDTWVASFQHRLDAEEYLEVLNKRYSGMDGEYVMLQEEERG